ncbi:MAG: molybdopterin-dependent oxidoreductase [Desulfobacterales bacterium]|nr:molybdopterin-dependent oxidoreductase [Desulfobacterales bacterium]
MEADYFTPYLAHATLEPMNCTAEVRADGCQLWVGTQSQVDTQAVAARITGLPRTKVRVHTRFLGGGFGRRLETDFVADAVELSKELKVPVQVIWTRADDLQHDKYRPAGAMRLAAALDGAGRPAALVHARGRLRAGPGRHPPAIRDRQRARRARQDRIGAADPVPGARSAPRNNAFAIECFVDELARAAGGDPVRATGLPAARRDRPRHRAVLERAARAAGWGAAAAARARARHRACTNCFGSVVAQVAEVEVTRRRIRVARVVGAIDCGQPVESGQRARPDGGRHRPWVCAAALKDEVAHRARRRDPGQLRATTRFSPSPRCRRSRYTSLPATAIRRRCRRTGTAARRAGGGERGVRGHRPAGCGNCRRGLADA